MEDLDLLWKLFEDNRNYAKHHENQRSTASNITMIVSAGILGLITFDKELTLADLPLALFLTLLGFFGALFSAKHYERVRLHLYRAEAYLQEIEQMRPDLGISTLRADANTKTRERFPRLSTIQLHRFWIVLHLFLAFIGGAIVVGIATGAYKGA